MKLSFKKTLHAQYLCILEDGASTKVILMRIILYLRHQPGSHQPIPAYMSAFGENREQSPCLLGFLKQDPLETESVSC